MDENLKITPALKQYMDIKAEYPDCILFFRMGDFYEMFFEDAEIAAPILEIALTSRNKNKENRVPMCGIPFHAAHSYLTKLVQAGKKVAICNQVEDPREAKGIVRREVVRVVSPGLITQDGSITSKANNYLASLNPLLSSKNIWGIASLDLSTGEFMATEVTSESETLSEIFRINPSEILIPESFKENIVFSSLKSSVPHIMLSFRPDVWFSLKRASSLLMDHFKTLSLDGFGISHLKSAVGSAGAILSYVQETQKGDVSHIREIRPYSMENHLAMDEATRRNLELISNAIDNGRYGTLLWVMDKTETPMGGRLIKKWITYPLRDIKKIEERLSSVEAFKENPTARNLLRKSLNRVYDLERLLGRITIGTSTPRDLLSLKDSIAQLADIMSLLEPFESRSHLLREIYNKMDPLDDLYHLIENSIREDAPPQVRDGRIIKEGFNEELDELIHIQRDGRSFIAGIEARERKRTEISSLKVGYNKVFGYYIEVPKTQTGKVPEDFIRKQTLVSAERYITPELKDVESKILNSQERRIQLEYEIFRSIRLAISKEAQRIKNTAESIARMDCLLALAEVAENNRYVRPGISPNSSIIIKKGRHPVVEQTIEKGRFVPNDLIINHEDSCMVIITGPNMAGKSTILRQSALITLMAQMGSFVPAEEAEVGILDQIFTRVGASDYLARGQSTFMVEMSETANILHNATSQSLVILDEIGRGTSTYDGLAIAWSVAEHLINKDGLGVKTLFATHYHELTNLADKFSKVRNMHVAVKEWEDNIVFLRHLMEGPSNKSYGIQVAALAGVPSTVIERAKEILTIVEKGPMEFAEEEKDTPNKSKEGRKKMVQKALPLFEDEWNRLREIILSCELDNTTPLKALNMLAKLQEVVKNNQ